MLVVNNQYEVSPPLMVTTRHTATKAWMAKKPRAKIALITFNHILFSSSRFAVENVTLK